MLFNKKISRSEYTDFMKCTIVCATVLPAVSFIGAIISNLTESPVATVNTVSFIALLLSAVLGGTVSTKMMQGQMKIPLFSALFITLVMMIIGLIVNRGAIPKSAAMNYVCYIAVFAFISFLSRGTGKKRSRKHRRKF